MTWMIWDSCSRASSVASTKARDGRHVHSSPTMQPPLGRWRPPVPTGDWPFMSSNQNALFNSTHMFSQSASSDILFRASLFTIAHQVSSSFNQKEQNNYQSMWVWLPMAHFHSSKPPTNPSASLQATLHAKSGHFSKCRAWPSRIAHSIHSEWVAKSLGRSSSSWGCNTQLHG